MYNSMVFSIFRVSCLSITTTSNFRTFFLPPTKETDTWFKALSFFGSGTSYCWRDKCHSFLSFSFVIQFLPYKFQNWGREGEDQGKEAKVVY